MEDFFKECQTFEDNLSQFANIKAQLADVERNNSYEENMRVPILKSLRYEQCLILQKIEFSLNVIFPTYVNDDETSDAFREIIMGHIGLCDRAFATIDNDHVVCFEDGESEGIDEGVLIMNVTAMAALRASLANCREQILL
eukprot:CAMPEP_0116057644 /NCGR_PEP_ID=MMETSP0322-20121206/4733_1 /TAXON_ID=163516 /ORGANISM="Leptocylindrus danicus var. apora, Strain B651" /LENGTH=140 /DNA_ID=CAMNT_0003541693 /DNA_START=77 /DNA_END=499 /DNA_ORIENTATION=-